MDIFTCSLSQWRVANAHGIEVVNTTQKSGLPIFAPSKHIVWGHKYYGMSDSEYRSQYVQQMNQSYFQNRQAWEEFLMFHRDGRIALACYCNKDAEFCHRFLLAPMLMKLAQHHHIPVAYYGEIR